MNKRNYQKEMENIIANECVDRKPTLLLHGCCAPCSSYCLEAISRYFDITMFYYNPIISSKEEFDKRVNELYKLLRLNGLEKSVKVIVPEYNNLEFFEAVKGLENEPECGKRCYVCYELRLRKAGIEAKIRNFDFFTTTLSISPHKNADWLNEIGERISKEMVDGPRYLPTDFKKKNGYKRSIEISKEYDLYRQDYCGCVYSKIQRDREKELALKENALVEKD